ncbi:MAG: hypothetical protein M1822_004331 [Bathelium mastoideum]|nr:MAG: hypothetical protein M1822_004331 [Bathelium mastoideum]
MPGTRSSARAAANSSSPNSSQGKETSSNGNAGSKREADTNASPPSKRGKKRQKTLDETMPGNDVENTSERIQEKAEEPEDEKPAEDEKTEKPQNGDHDNHAEESDQSKPVPDSAPNANSAIEHSSQREKTMPSTILEKGIIYFFTRGRVGVDEPESVQDLARSYFVLRPLPTDAKLGDGTIEDLKNNRLCALPKKVLPKSGRDRFMTFVEKANATIQDLKENFMQGSDYSTKTAGTRQTPPVTPVGEGVYAITTTGRESHLAYLLTIPSEIGEVQEEMGIRTKGSFVVSLKNPEAGGPANASLPQAAEYSQEIMEEFRGLRWMPAAPKHLDYANAQFLLIGEGQENVSKALEPSTKDEKHGKKDPEEEMEQLEHEDELRVEHLKGDDTIFADLGISQEDYPKVQTTW